MKIRIKPVYRQKVKYFILGFLALSLGLLIYLLLRPNTHISRFLLSFFSLDIPNVYGVIDYPFFKFYLVDYLWAFGFSCWLCCIFIEQRNGALCSMLIVSIIGITYELMQFFDVILGTGDVLDCLLYVLAGWTVNTLKI